MGGLARLWLPAYLSALAFGCRERGGGGGEELEEEEEEDEGEEEGEEVCVRGGGFGISCSVVVAVSARVSLLLSVFEQQRLCSAAGVEREHFVPLCVCVCVYVCVQAGVCVCVCVCVCACVCGSSLLRVIVSIPAMLRRCVSDWLCVIMTPQRQHRH